VTIRWQARPGLHHRARGLDGGGAGRPPTARRWRSDAEVRSDEGGWRSDGGGRRRAEEVAVGRRRWRSDGGGGRRAEEVADAGGGGRTAERPVGPRGGGRDGPAPAARVRRPAPDRGGSCRPDLQHPARLEWTAKVRRFLQARRRSPLPAAWRASRQPVRIGVVGRHEPATTATRPATRNATRDPRPATQPAIRDPRTATRDAIRERRLATRDAGPDPRPATTRNPAHAPRTNDDGRPNGRPSCAESDSEMTREGACDRRTAVVGRGEATTSSVACPTHRTGAGGPAPGRHPVGGAPPAQAGGAWCTVAAPRGGGPASTGSGRACTGPRPARRCSRPAPGRAS
jgi:hypothetical protein